MYGGGRGGGAGGQGRGRFGFIKSLLMQPSNIQTTFLKRLNKAESKIFDLFLVFFVYNGNLVTAVKRLPVFHCSADYIFISFGIIEPILVTFDNKYRLSPVLVGVCDHANYIATYEGLRFPLFFCFVCFQMQRQPFRVFMWLHCSCCQVPCGGRKNVSPYFTLVHIIFLFPLGSSRTFWLFWTSNTA